MNPVFVATPTVRVEVVDLPSGGRVVRKSYSFPRWSQRLRAAHRHTWLGKPKGEREAANLNRLAAGGAPVVAPLESGSRRDLFGFVRETWLTLPYLDHHIGFDCILAGEAEAPGVDRPELWREIGRGVRRLHDLGCFYRDLRPRNLLVGAKDHLWIDASKSRWFRPPLPPARAAEDLAAFLLPIAEADDLREADWNAFQTGYAAFEDLNDPLRLLEALGNAARQRVGRALARERERGLLSASERERRTIEG